MLYLHDLSSSNTNMRKKIGLSKTLLAFRNFSKKKTKKNLLFLSKIDVSFCCSPFQILR